MGPGAEAVTRVLVGVAIGVAICLVAAMAAADASLTIELEGVDHVWHLSYPGPDGVPGGGDDFAEQGDLHVPAGVPIELVVTSADYIYRLWSPPLGLNQMAIPGKTLTARFSAERPGNYELRGEPMCGLKLDDMNAVIRVLTPDEFASWSRERATAGSR